MFVFILDLHSYTNPILTLSELEAGMIRVDTTVRPIEATSEDLMVVHTKGYLDSLKVWIKIVPHWDEFSSTNI